MCIYVIYLEKLFLKRLNVRGCCRNGKELNVFCCMKILFCSLLVVIYWVVLWFFFLVSILVSLSENRYGVFVFMESCVIERVKKKERRVFKLLS